MGSTRIHPGSHSDNKIDPSLRNVPHLNPHGNVMTTTNSRLEVIGVSCTLSVKKKQNKVRRKIATTRSVHLTRLRHTHSVFGAFHAAWWVRTALTTEYPNTRQIIKSRQTHFLSGSPPKRSTYLNGTMSIFWTSLSFLIHFELFQNGSCSWALLRQQG